jgi:hypothetical protein
MKSLSRSTLLPILISIIGVIMIWLVIPPADAMTNVTISVESATGTGCASATYTLRLRYTPNNNDDNSTPPNDFSAITVTDAAGVAVDAFGFISQTVPTSDIFSTTVTARLNAIYMITTRPVTVTLYDIAFNPTGYTKVNLFNAVTTSGAPIQATLVFDPINYISNCAFIPYTGTVTPTITLAPSNTPTPTMVFTPGPPSAVNTSITPINLDSDTAIGVTSEGLAYIAYRNGLQHLQMVRCLNSDCSQRSEGTIDSGFQTGSGISLKMNSQGLPVMAYYDYANDRVKLARCTNINCASSVYVLTANDVATGFLSLDLDSNDIPYVAYRAFGGAIVLLRCNSATNCNSPTTITTISGNGNQIAFELDSNNIPIIVDSGGARLIRCESSTTCNTPTISNFISATGTISQVSLVLNSSNIPWMLHRGGGEARLARCESASNCNSPTIFALGAAFGTDYLSLAIDNDVPVAAFVFNSPVGTNDYVTIARCENASTCNTPSLLPSDSNRESGDEISLAIHSGIPYLSFTNNMLRFYRGPNNTPLLVNNVPLTIPPLQTAVIDNTKLLTTDVDTFQTLTYRVVSPPTNGTLSLGSMFTQAQIDANALTYTHTSGISDSFTFSVSDEVTVIGVYTYSVNVNVVASPTSSATPTATATITSSPSATATSTATPTATPTNTATATPTLTSTAPSSVTISENEFFEALVAARQGYPDIITIIPDFVPDGINMIIAVNGGIVGNVSVAVTQEQGFVTLTISGMSVDGTPAPESYTTIINRDLPNILTTALDAILTARFGGTVDANTMTITADTMYIAVSSQP